MRHAREQARDLRAFADHRPLGRDSCRGRRRARRIPRRDRYIQGRDGAENRAVAAAWQALRYRRPQGRPGASAPGPGFGMIRYNLRCEKGHAFESWFQSSAAYESQEKRKLVGCPNCGSVKVERAIMAPQIVTKKGREAAAPAPAAPAEVTASSESTPLLMAQERELRAKLKELRDHIVKNADNVGERFPNEARKMHYG